MSFGGAVSAMITSLKNNKRDRKSRFDKKGGDMKTPKHIPFVDHKKLSLEDELQLKAKIRLKAKQHTKKIFLYSIIACVLLAILIWWLILDSGRSFI